MSSSIIEPNKEPNKELNIKSKLQSYHTAEVYQKQEKSMNLSDYFPILIIDIS